MKGNPTTVSFILFLNLPSDVVQEPAADSTTVTFTSPSLILLLLFTILLAPTAVALFRLWVATSL